MKQVFQDIKIGLLFVGTIIGAGFASGRELISFFGGYGAFVLPLAVLLGVLFFLTGWLFLKIGGMIRPESFGDITRAVLGKGAGVMNVLITVSYFILFSAMLAGVDALFREAFRIDLGFPVFGLVTAVAAVFVVTKGMNGLINANSVLVPLIVVFILGVSVVSLLLPENTSATPYTTAVPHPGAFFGMLVNALLYVAMNMLLTASVLGSAGRDLKRRSVNTGSAVGAGIIMLTIVMILYALYSADAEILNKDLPMLYLAGRYGKAIAVLSGIVVWFGVFTTLASSLYPLVERADKLVKKRWITVPVILAIGFAVSLLGFSGIVDLLYPVMGAIGLFFILSTAVYYFRERHRSVPAPGEAPVK